ncbi:MAG: type II secretion system protein GspD [Planctomycetes bacterium]|nr:type II secretion system protein GspD [Planctomycetota bacterium]
MSRPGEDPERPDGDVRPGGTSPLRGWGGCATSPFGGRARTGGGGLPQGLALVLAPLVLLSSCLGGGSDSLERHRKAQSMFEDLLTRGQNAPAGVESFDDEAAFEGVEAAYMDDPIADYPSAGAAAAGGGTAPGPEVAPPVGPELPSEAGGEDEVPTGVAEGDELEFLSGLVEEAAPADPPLNPYLEFGKNIIWYELRDGDTERLIMKPYTFPGGTGSKIFSLLQSYGAFTLFAAVKDGAMPEGSGPQPQDTVLLDLREGFSVEAYSDPRGSGLRAPQSIALSDVLFVTAAAKQLGEVEHFIDLFAAEVRQIEIEAKIVEVTTRDSLDLGVKPVDPSTPVFGFPNPGTFVNQIDFSFANSTDASKALFQLGAVFDGVTFNAVLEAVASFENVSIISRPKVAVREGGRADIVNVKKIPFYNVTAISASGIPTTSLQFQEVGVQMYVVPRVIGRDTVILNIDIEASQSTGTAVSFTVGDSVISVPEISKRNARTVVRLEPGQAVILGGLISERTVTRESKVPLVGDIPVLGALFRSKLKSKEQTNVLFFIRPRILEGSDLNSPF